MRFSSISDSFSAPQIPLAVSVPGKGVLPTIAEEGFQKDLLKGGLLTAGEKAELKLLGSDEVKPPWQSVN